MFKSLKSKLVIPIIGLLILVISAFVAYASMSTYNVTEELTRQRLVGSAQTTRAYLEFIEDRNNVTALALSQNANVVEHLSNWNSGTNPAANRQDLLGYLHQSMGGFGLDAVVVVDRNGNVMLRTHESHYGDSIAGYQPYSRAMLGGSSSHFATSPTMPMALASITPIVLNNEIIGAISAYVFLHTDGFMDAASYALSADVTVFAWNISVATTVGQRVPGTQAAESITQQVLNQGSEYLGQIPVLGVSYSAFYIPLRGWDNGIIGMFFMGFSNAAGDAAYATLQRNMILIGVVATIIVAGLMYMLISHSLRPLKDLQRKVRAVSAGNVNINKAQNLPGDEIGALTKDVYSLVDVVKSMVEDLSNAYHQYIKVGDMSHAVDTGKYENSFKDMMGLINKLLSDMTTDIDDLAETIDRIADGEFNVNVDTSIWVGDWVAMPNAINKLTGNLQAVDNEINRMIKAASKDGDLNFRIDENKYRGEWINIMQGLNGIAEAVAKPINETMSVMENLSQGEFNTKMTGNYNGAFLEIKNSVNTTIDTLSIYIYDITKKLASISGGDLTTEITRDYVGDFVSIKESLNNISLTLHRTMKNISSASDQVSEGSRMMSDNAAKMANDALNSAGSIEELNATMDLINQQTKQNHESAFEANDLSNLSTENAEKGNAAVNKMLEAMSQIKESSIGVSKIVKTIQDIAFQTNLLALNASVEAARAGEHGRGFSVVAEEVRGLAARSQAAATETTDLIKDSIARVEAGANIASGTSESLSIIVKNAEEVLAVIGKITMASTEQTEAISQVTGGLEQIAHIVQSNTYVAENAALASEELSSQAEMLRELVGFFKL